MKRGSKPIMRRHFLKTGIARGALIAALPLGKLISSRAFYSDSLLKSQPNLSVESKERLLEVVLKYESEFGGIRVDDI